MNTLLFLVHRIPYPPNKGDKIRSFHQLRFLSKHYRIFLGAFVDDAHDWQYADELQSYCEAVHLVPLSKRRALLRSATALFRRQPLSLPYYKDQRMQRMVNSVLERERPEAILVYSSTMAQYVEHVSGPAPRRVVDMVDVDSEKWRAYSREKAWPARWVYQREADRLLTYERKIAREFDTTVLVSQAEAELFSSLCAQTPPFRPLVVENGVDSGYFDPTRGFENPYAEHERAVVFTGAMDYWANVDAVDFFAREALPALKQRYPEIVFYVVGSNPSAAVQELASLDAVKVTGRVDDVRPYLHHAACVVAPLRIARGVQNKVLEAMAMAKPVVATQAAIAGIDPGAKSLVPAADTAVGLVNAVSEVLDRGATEAPENRRFVMDTYRWARSLERLQRALAGANADSLAIHPEAQPAGSAVN